MLKKLGESGGPEEDRTPDLFIANDTLDTEINDLRRCSSVENRPNTGGECTNRAQVRVRLMDWFLRWRLRRAERALSEARSRREAADLENPDYAGLYPAQVVEERRIEQRIADLKQRLESPEDGSYCLKCGKVSQWHPKRGCTVCQPI